MDGYDDRESRRLWAVLRSVYGVPQLRKAPKSTFESSMLPLLRLAKSCNSTIIREEKRPSAMLPFVADAPECSGV